ncbi:MAG: aconitase X catalytic domain-containing protein [Candidatus Bathyarchaeota archaeon]|nr:aconitase X catalytic domain-containing protein [Candidatus Bathyarchaeota archaeon]
MYLTKEEERIYDGEYGWANQICMKILVRLGELFNAIRLIPISSAHVAGVSYKTLGDAPAEFLQALAKADGKAKVRATLNPQSFDPEYLGRRLPKHIREKQLNILKQFEKMGFTRSLTCTPYYLEKPKRDSHLAWAESSAVVYANSVLGAWTNREGGPSALAAAIIGKTPDYGMHRAENRQSNILVDVKTSLRNESEFGALGIYLGKILEDKIPVIQGLNDVSEVKLKQLGAALATTGMVNMFYHNTRRERGEIEKIIVEAEDLKRTSEELSTTAEVKPDLVFIGCPHCSLDEIRKIAGLMDDKKVRAGTEFWVCTSCYVKERAEDYVKKIEKSGGCVLTDMCTIVSWTETLGIKTIMTNSAKTAYYAPTLNKAETVFAPLKQCLDTTLEG